MILGAKFGDNPLIHKIQYFISISIFVHVKLFLFLGRESNFVQNKTNNVVVLQVNKYSVRPWL